jgi:hypothetical protein
MSDVASLSRGQRVTPPVLTDTDEYPQPLGSAPLWSENYLTHAYDHTTGVGIFLHFNRVPFNQHIWEGVFACYLPGDRFLVVRDFSWDENNHKGPGANNLRYEVIEPFRQWRKTFRGAARLVTGTELRAGPLNDGIHVFVDMDLVFDGSGPAFNLQDMGKQFWGTDHYEQHGDITGRIHFDGAHVGLGSESYDFSGPSLRDHSHGPRDLRPMKNSAWLHGDFPSGRRFLLFHVWLKAGPPYKYFRVGDQDGFALVELTSETPLIQDLDQALDPYELHFAGTDGAGVIRAEPLQALPFSFVGPNEWVIGRHVDAHHLCVETMSRFEWDGEIGYGNSERSVYFPD